MLARRLITLTTAAWLGVALLAAAQSREEARPRDLRELQAELTNLDADLASLEAGSPRSESFRERAEEIREETVYLKVKMRRHQRAGGTGTGVDDEEVDDLRRSIRGLRDDIAGGRRRGPREARLAEGTEIVIRLEEALSSRTAQQEDRFEAVVARPVRTQGVVVLPAGTRVRGLVQNAEPARRPSKSGRLELDFDALYVDNTRVDMRSRVTSIGDEDEDRHATETKAGAGVLLGGTLGAILGGKEGAVIGAVLGGGGAVVATKGNDVELPEGTLVTVRLDRLLTVPRPSRDASRSRVPDAWDEEAPGSGRVNKER
jgi:hypothetical protein